MNRPAGPGAQAPPTPFHTPPTPFGPQPGYAAPRPSRKRTRKRHPLVTVLLFVIVAFVSVFLLGAIVGVIAFAMGKHPQASGFESYGAETSGELYDYTHALPKVAYTTQGKPRVMVGLPAQPKVRVTTEKISGLTATVQTVTVTGKTYELRFVDYSAMGSIRTDAEHPALIEALNAKGRSLNLSAANVVDKWWRSGYNAVVAQGSDHGIPVAAWLIIHDQHHVFAWFVRTKDNANMVLHAFVSSIRKIDP